VNCVRHIVPTPVTVKIGQVGGREALVDADGCALYVNTQDRPQVSACDQQCRAAFPPAPGPAQAGAGVNQSNLGTFTRPDGTIQATFFGHQLYYDAQDTQPGQANGQGLNQTWFLIDRNATTLTS
jgi:predicted lipoprotein with Yx(FWY)xxD motif